MIYYAKYALAASSGLCAFIPFAQAQILPLKPTSADNIQIAIGRGACFNDYNPVGVNPYTVGMKNNHITVTFPRASAYKAVQELVVTGPPSDRLRFIDIGKLPAGQYILGVEDENPSEECKLRNTILPKAIPLTVTDARALKSAPYPLVDISGHWWNPNDSGTALVSVGTASLMLEGDFI